MKVEKILKDGDVLVRFDPEEIEEIAVMLRNVSVQSQELESLADNFEQLDSLTQ